MGMTKAALTRKAPMSEIIVMKNTAPRLQRVPSMKSIFVGLLAVFALTGCGVGMDGLEGDQASSDVSVEQPLAASSDNSTSSQTEMRGPINQDPRVQLPQDPIPVFEAKTAGTGTPRPTK
jgi:hypothetical protein